MFDIVCERLRRRKTESVNPSHYQIIFGKHQYQSMTQTRFLWFLQEGWDFVDPISDLFLMKWVRVRATPGGDDSDDDVISGVCHIHISWRLTSLRYIHVSLKPPMMHTLPGDAATPWQAYCSVSKKVSCVILFDWASPESFEQQYQKLAPY